MGQAILFQTSLIAAFIGGMVALFAPCCISFLLPAYLGNVFKEKEKVLLMTVVFGLGIFVVLMPAVLGVAVISKALFRYHDTIYIIGGLVMLGVALISFLGMKLPMPHFSRSANSNKVDVASVFTLGVFSGLTSACCAPVLVGILAMTFLSPSFFGALLIGAVYVMGMVTPLLLIALFLSGKMPNLSFLRRPFSKLTIFGKDYPLVLNNMIAGFVFFVTGSLTLILTLSGKLSEGNMEEFSNFIKNVSGSVNNSIGGNILVNILFIAGIGFLIYIISKKI